MIVSRGFRGHVMANGRSCTQETVDRMAEEARSEAEGFMARENTTGESGEDSDTAPAGVNRVTFRPPPPLENPLPAAHQARESLAAATGGSPRTAQSVLFLGTQREERGAQGVVALCLVV